MQFDPEEIKTDHYRLVGGGSSYSMTHLPTGISVHEEEMVCDQPILNRLEELTHRLKLEVDRRELPPKS
jgi:hypothetical protein